MTLQSVFEAIQAYWINFLMVIISGYLVTQLKSIRDSFKKFNTDQQEMRHSLLALSQTQITEIYTIHMKLGYCPIAVIESAEKLYQSYCMLGGNGTMKTLMAELHNLPKLNPLDKLIP